MADVSKIQLPSGDTYDIVDSKSGYIKGMTILSYGKSTWQDFINAYNSNKVVYCRASSNSNPATGSQTRLAFMAYVSNETTPTNVEFQYYRSVSSHTASQQGDQVYVYKLTNAGAWTVTVREASVKVNTTNATGTKEVVVSYSNGAITIGHPDSYTSSLTQAVYPITISPYGHIASYGNAVTIPTKVSDLTNDSGFITASEVENGYLPLTGGTVTGGTTFQDTVTLDYFYSSHAHDNGYYIIRQGWGGEDPLFIGYNKNGVSYGIEVGSSSTSILGLRTPVSNDDAATKKYVDDSVGALTIPTITLNGGSTTSPSFYAPTSAGTSGYYLKSNGSGAPTWAALSSSRNVFYTTCDTLASTTIKATTVTGFSFDEGNIIGVYFSTGNTNDEPRLKVNDTTKYIRIGNVSPSGTGNVLKWSAGTLVYFVYDGTYFQYITSVSAASVEQSRGANVWYGTSSTGRGYPNKVATINNFILTKGAIVAITFTNSSRVDDAAAFTLNINSTGAKAIYFQNAATSSSNVISWSEGQTLFFVYTGEYYYLLGKDEVNTDEKVIVTNDSSANIKHYPVIGGGSGSSPQTLKIDTTGFKYTWFDGTTGSADLELGNSTASGTTGNKQGRIKLFSSGTNYSILSNDTLTETRVIKLPDKDGTIALTSDIPTVPTITLNGSSTTSPSFYAPTGAGTNGYVLTSSGSGAPSWTSGELTDEKIKPLSEVTNSQAYKVLLSYGTVAQNPRTADLKYYQASSYAEIAVGSPSRKGQLTLQDTSGKNVIIKPTTLTDFRTLTLPDATGTVALTSDITDEKVKTNPVSNDTVYYPIVGSNTSSAATKYYDASGLKYSYISSSQTAALMIGNETAISSNGKKGILRLGGSTQFKGVIDPGAPTADRTYTLPDASGTIALTSDISGKVDKTCTYTDIDDTSGTQTIFNGLEDDGEGPWNRLYLNHTAQWTDNNTDYTNDNHIELEGGRILMRSARTQSNNNSVYSETFMNIMPTEIVLTHMDSDGRTGSIGLEQLNNNFYAFISTNILELGEGSYVYSIDCSSPTANRTLTLPDASGTVALTSDITDEKVKNTKIDPSYPAVTYYLSGSQSSSTATEELVKSDVVSVSLAQITQGVNIAELTLGKINSTGTMGCIRLCGVNGNNTLIQPSSVSSFTQIDLPDTTGTLALTSDIPNVKSEVLDMFYPVGSYYETSDTTFNPNTAWGGTWILEAEGQVHVSAGTNYSVSGATTNTSDGGADQIVYTPTGSTADVKLSDAQIAHGHTYTNPSVTTPTLTASKSTFITSASAVSSLNRSLGSAGTSGGDYNYVRVAHTGSTLDRQAPSIASGKSCTVSGGSVANLSGASSTRTTHTHAFTGTQAQLDNMQPYIIVNRWHRTA